MISAMRRWVRLLVPRGIGYVRERRGLPRRLLESRVDARQGVHGHQGVRSAGVIVQAQDGQAARQVDVRPVQRILRRRLTASGTPQYHTLWEGYLAAEATWEPAESFAGCKELLDTFERGQA
jgi:hypothetical protein